MEQAGEVDYLITWRDNEFVGRVSLTHVGEVFAVELPDPVPVGSRGPRVFGFPGRPGASRRVVAQGQLSRCAVIPVDRPFSVARAGPAVGAGPAVRAER
jgi:hypothetical protein